MASPSPPSIPDRGLIDVPGTQTMRQILDPDVLRRQVLQFLQAAQHGDVSTEWLRGYLTAIFHAGVISQDECRRMIAGEREPFELTPLDAMDDAGTGDKRMTRRVILVDPLLCVDICVCLPHEDRGLRLG